MLEKQKTQKSKHEIPKNNKGITLIALVITIVVMLILVAVTISMAVNGGLFDYAGRATEEMQNAINAEQQLANGKIKIGGKWYVSIDDYIAGNPLKQGITLDIEELELTIASGYDVETSTAVTRELNAILNEIQGTLTWTSDNEEVAKVTSSGTKAIVTAISAGTAKIKVSCTYEEQTYTAECTVTVKLLVPEGLKVGDYVNYKPTAGTYKVADGENGTGYTTTEGYQEFTTEVDDETTEDVNEALQWRVWSIDEETGEVEIVSATAAQTETSLYLKGADGYNHGVDILNDLCEALYSNENGATARSINVGDINAKTTYIPTKDTKEYKYSDYGDNYRVYPNLYVKEEGIYLGGIKQTGGLCESSGLDDGLETDGVTKYKTVRGKTNDNDPTLTKNISVTNTYYKYTPESYLANLGINTTPTGLIKAAVDYWLASRFVNTVTSTDRVSFGLRSISSGGSMWNEKLYDSNMSGAVPGKAVRPIVLLGVNVSLILDEDNTTGTTTYWDIEY